MLSKLYFDVPAQITPAVHLVVECLGGLDLDNPEFRPVRDQVGYALKAPRELTLADIVDINRKVAAHFGTQPAIPDDEESFASVAQATELTVLAIARLANADWEVGTVDEFSPQGNVDELLYGHIHCSYDGNNLVSAAY